MSQGVGMWYFVVILHVTFTFACLTLVAAKAPRTPLYGCSLVVSALLGCQYTPEAVVIACSGGDVGGVWGAATTAADGGGELALCGAVIAACVQVCLVLGVLACFGVDGVGVRSPRGASGEVGRGYVGTYTTYVFALITPWVYICASLDVTFLRVLLGLEVLNFITMAYLCHSLAGAAVAELDAQAAAVRLFM